MINRALRGFSLIELTIAVTLLSGVSLILLTASINGLETFSIIRTKQNAFSAFLEMYTRIDNFTRIAVEFPDSYTSPGGSVFTKGPTTLIMKLKGLSGLGTAECEGFDYVVYYVENSDLHELVVGATDSARASHDQIAFVDLDTLTFTQDKSANEHRLVTVSASFLEKSQGRLVTQSHSQSMVARND